MEIVTNEYALWVSLALLPGRLTLIVRLRLDAALYQPAPKRLPHTNGRPRKKGARLPTLEQVAANRWVLIRDPKGKFKTQALLCTEVVALDGKTTGGSHDAPNGKAALHLVSAWATTNRLVLGQVKVADKSNEITAIPELFWCGAEPLGRGEQPALGLGCGHE